jgi:hypothetical protein
MHRFLAGLFVGIIGTAAVGGAAFLLMPVTVGKLSLSKEEQAVFDHTKLQCKSEAKAHSLGAIERRKYVANCVVDALWKHPDLDPYDLD